MRCSFWDFQNPSLSINSNSFNLNKHQSIINFLRQLHLLNIQLDIVDYWEADRCAIGLKKDNKLTYISTYNYINEEVIKYDYDFEIYDTAKPDTIHIVKSKTGISSIEFIIEIKVFFNIL